MTLLKATLHINLNNGTGISNQTASCPSSNLSSNQFQFKSATVWRLLYTLHSILKTQFLWFWNVGTRIIDQNPSNKTIKILWPFHEITLNTKWFVGKGWLMMQTTTLHWKIYFHFLFKFNPWIYDKYLTPYLLLVYLVLAPNFDMSVKGWLVWIKSCLIVTTDNEHWASLLLSLWSNMW